MHGSWKGHLLYVVSSRLRHGKPETQLQPSVKQRAGEINGSVGRVLASQAQRPEFHPQNSLKKKPGIVACVCNPGTEEVETEDPWDSLAGKSGLLGEFLARERPCFKKRMDREREREQSLLVAKDLASSELQVIAPEREYGTSHLLLALLLSFRRCNFLRVEANKPFKPSLQT